MQPPTSHARVPSVTESTSFNAISPLHCIPNHFCHIKAAVAFSWRFLKFLSACAQLPRALRSFGGKLLSANHQSTRVHRKYVRSHSSRRSLLGPLPSISSPCSSWPLHALPSAPAPFASLRILALVISVAPPEPLSFFTVSISAAVLFKFL